MKDKQTFTLLPIALLPAPAHVSNLQQYTRLSRGSRHGSPPSPPPTRHYLQASPELGCSHLPSNLAALRHIGVTFACPFPHPALVSPCFPGMGERLPPVQCKPASARHEANTLSHSYSIFCVWLSCTLVLQLIRWRIIAANLGGKKASSLGRERTRSRRRWDRVLCKSHIQSTKSYFFPSFIFSQVFLLITVTMLGPRLLQHPQKEFFKGS